MFCTKEQQVVVNCRLSDGYTLVGKSKSNLNGLDVFVIAKVRHTMAINSLGYDEHTAGKIWKLEE